MSDVCEIVKGAIIMVFIWLLSLAAAVIVYRLVKSLREFIVLRRVLGMSGKRKNETNG